MRHHDRKAAEKLHRRRPQTSSSSLDFFVWAIGGASGAHRSRHRLDAAMGQKRSAS